MTELFEAISTSRGIFLAALFFIVGVAHAYLWHRLHDERYRLVQSVAWLFMSFVWVATEFRESSEWITNNQRFLVSLAQTGLAAAELYALFVINDMVRRWKM